MQEHILTHEWEMNYVLDHKFEFRNVYESQTFIKIIFTNYCLKHSFIEVNNQQKYFIQ